MNRLKRRFFRLFSEAENPRNLSAVEIDAALFPKGAKGQDRGSALPFRPAWRLVATLTWEQQVIVSSSLTVVFGPPHQSPHRMVKFWPCRDGTIVLGQGPAESWGLLAPVDGERLDDPGVCQLSCAQVVEALLSINLQPGQVGSELFKSLDIAVEAETASDRGREIAKLSAALRAGDDWAALSWFDRQFPEVMKGMTSEARAEFLRGVRERWAEQEPPC